MPSNARLANEAWEALYRAQATVARELTEADVWDELNPREYGVLYALVGHPGGLRMSELLNDVLLTQTGMSRLIHRLETGGLVRRIDDPDDRRACRIQLTDAGRDVQRAVGLRHGRHVAQTMSQRLSPDQLLQLRELCLALIATDSRQ
jgi:DNA-binding MarR family transcriptional regulator